jgi:predicted NAD/FAD-dependent oxidoreductase
VILAAAPAQAEHLLNASDLAPNPAWSFEYEAITTCYLSYAPTLSLPAPFLALVDDAERAHWGQFVFDRGQLDSSQAGMLAVIISASGPALEGGKEALSQGITAQLAQAFQRPELAFPMSCHVITEKRASFACTPALPRPRQRTSHAGLWLAGDYTEGPYPATLEGAVRSGLAAAQAMLSE